MTWRDLLAVTYNAPSYTPLGHAVDALLPMPAGYTVVAGTTSYGGWTWGGGLRFSWWDRTTTKPPWVERSVGEPVPFDVYASLSGHNDDSGATRGGLGLFPPTNAGAYRFDADSSLALTCTDYPSDYTASDRTMGRSPGRAMWTADGIDIRRYYDPCGGPDRSRYRLDALLGVFLPMEYATAYWSGTVTPTGGGPAVSLIRGVQRWATHAVGAFEVESGVGWDQLADAAAEHIAYTPTLPDSHPNGWETLWGSGFVYGPAQSGMPPERSCVTSYYKFATEPPVTVDNEPWEFTYGLFDLGWQESPRVGYGGPIELRNGVRAIWRDGRVWTRGTDKEPWAPGAYLPAGDGLLVADNAVGAFDSVPSNLDAVTVSHSTDNGETLEPGVSAGLPPRVSDWPLRGLELGQADAVVDGVPVAVGATLLAAYGDESSLSSLNADGVTQVVAGPPVAPYVGTAPAPFVWELTGVPLRDPSGRLRVFQMGYWRPLSDAGHQVEDVPVNAFGARVQKPNGNLVEPLESFATNAPLFGLARPGGVWAPNGWVMLIGYDRCEQRLVAFSAVRPPDGGGNWGAPVFTADLPEPVAAYVLQLLTGEWELGWRYDGDWVQYRTVHPTETWELWTP